jgi:glutathione peroxidase-family protein
VNDKVCTACYSAVEVKLSSKVSVNDKEEHTLHPYLDNPDKRILGKDNLDGT